MPEKSFFDNEFEGDKLEIISPTEIIRKIKSFNKYYYAWGCANASGFFDEFVKSIDEFTNLEVLSGLSLGSYPYLKRGLNKQF